MTKRILGTILLLAASLSLAKYWNVQLSTALGLSIGVAWALTVLLAMVMLLTSFNSKPKEMQR